MLFSSLPNAEKIIPQSIVASFTHDIFFKGCQTFLLNETKDIETGDLYPDESFLTMDECFDEFVMKMQEKSLNHLV